jgi:Zn-finger nucleic acid-binding protein/ribosomal protein L40E
MAKATCPRDGETLADQDVFGDRTPVGVCPRCVGVLVPWSQARRLFERKSLTLSDIHSLVQQAERKAPLRAPVTCTACGDSPLKSFSVKGIELDLCEACGHVWFDRQELSRLTQGEFGRALGDDAQVLPGERSQVDGVYEMLWDCAYCDAKKLLGASNRHCPNCGAAQDASRRYFPAEGEAVASNHEFDGADKTCASCQTPNGAKAHHCRQCGAPLDGAHVVGTVADQSTRRAAVVAPKKRGPLFAVLGAISAATCGVCGFSVFWTKDVNVTVASHSWERSIDVESLRAVNESAWCDSMPVGAFSVSRHRAQRETRRVADGEMCHTRNVDRGNGTFEQRRECEPKYREEPVYDDRCDYSIDRWVVSRSPTARGQGLLPAPTWPALSLREGSCRGCERMGARHETYNVSIRGPDGTEWQCDVDERKWKSLEEGSQRQVKVGVLTGGARCSSL